MKILVTGVTGQVGWELMRSLQPLGEVIGMDRRQLDLTNPDSIRSLLREIQPRLIVNPAAYTAVDKAESEPELAMRINGIAPGIMAEEAKRLGAALIHYSTDYVFDGTKDSAYNEDDTPNPQSVYGTTKLAGEQAIQAVNCDHLILRTSWVYASRGKNFLKTILRLAQERDALRIVADQIGAPTSARLIADTTAQAASLVTSMVKSNQHIESGIYHLTASGETSWHGFASTIIEQSRIQLPHLSFKVAQIEPIASIEYPVPAPRPSNSRLNCSKLRNHFNLMPPAWQTGVQLCLAEMSESGST